MLGDSSGHDQSRRMSRSGGIYQQVLFLLVLVLLSGTCRAAVKTNNLDPSRTNDLINQFVINAERYQVRTEDGYHVTMYRLLPRVPYNRGVVLLQHGIRQTSADWLTRINNLPQQLLASGLEVWLGNSRASEESVGSILNRNLPEELWTFSFHEIGYYDLAAMIDATLEISGHRKVHLVGYSEGATASLILLSERPSYNAKIATLNLLAPAAFMSTNQLKAVAQIFGQIQPFIPEGVRSLFDSGNQLTGNSVRELEHFQQLIMSGRFRRFDYGPQQNLQKYGSWEPPDYPLDRITVPIVIHHGKMDFTVLGSDIERLRQALRGSTGVAVVEYDTLGHTDFLQLLEVVSSVYPRVVQNVLQRL